MEKKILVIGDSCIDSYAYCRSTRLAPDKPVPVLEVLDTVNTPGMAYNVFRNVVSLTKFPKGIDLLTNERYEDVVKTRYVDAFSNHMFMRVDSVVNIDRIKDNNIRDGYDTVIISDYDKGFLTIEDIEYICTNHPQVFLDTKKILGNWANAARFIKINNHEYERSKDYFQNTNVQDRVIQTMGSEGCYFNGKQYSVEQAEVMDLSGAGDTFMAALAVKYTETGDIDSSITYANSCASQVVKKRGTTVV